MKYVQRWSEPLHVSWMITWLCIGFIVGVAMAPMGLIVAGLPLYVSAMTLIILALQKRTLIFVFCIIFAGVLAGLARGSGAYVATQQLTHFYGEVVEISGKVSDDPSITSTGNQRVMLTDIVIDKKNYTGKIWVDTTAQAELKRSDSVLVSGVLSEGFGTISGSMFRAHVISVTHTIHADVGLEVRDWFARAIRTHISETEASLGAGYLIGQRSSLPESLDEKLRLLGLTHVVVASGYNLTILVRFARRLFVKHSKYLAMISASGMIIGFVLITGMSPSMSRAALVTGLSLLAWYYGRRVHPFVLLPFAAAITVALNPLYIWGDIGWYLSFTSFAGILILAPLIKAYFFGDEKPNTMIQIFIETMSAQLATLPIIAFIFGQYSLLALPANMLILPLVPLAMLLTFVAGIVQILVSPLGFIAAQPAQYVLQYMTYIIDWLGKIPWAGGALSVDVSVLFAGYGLLILIIIFLLRKTKLSFKHENVVL